MDVNAVLSCPEDVLACLQSRKSEIQLCMTSSTNTTTRASLLLGGVRL